MTPRGPVVHEATGAPVRARLAVALVSGIVGILGPRYRGRAWLTRIQPQRIARRQLRATIVEPRRHQPDDVTVLIGLRNRTDHRLALALRSIQEQSYPAALVRTLVVDYGSEPAAAAQAEQTCRAHGAAYVRVDTDGVWSRSRCLNAGLRRTSTKFVLTSDVDILFAPGYLATAIGVLREAPLSVVCSAMLDLPESSAEALRHISDTGAALRLHDWKAHSTPRLDWESHPSVAMTYTAFHHLIRGYDESYELWGAEDSDLFRRLTDLGIEERIVAPDAAFYLHQWHPKYESLPTLGLEEAVRRNRERWRRLHTIIRNGVSWGERR